MAVSKEEWLTNLRRAAAHFEVEHGSAATDGRWLTAYESRLSALIWRAAALAIQQGFIEHRLNLGAGALDLARLMRAEVMAVADDLEPSRDETSDFRKAEVITDLLTALLDGVGVMEGWTGADPQEPPFTALRGYELGRTEVALSLAESGHWEQIAKWQATQGGRPKGYRQQWRLDIAEPLQSWIDADPSGQIISLMNQMHDWLDDYRVGRKGFDRPDFESLRVAIREMHKQGLICHPRWATPTP